MANCKSCGKTIVWGVTEAGTKVPLDPAPPVYRIDGINYDRPREHFGRPEASTKITRDKDAMVSHFITCPNATQHSKKNKKETL